MKHRLIHPLFFLLLLLCANFKMRAQLSGSYPVPGTYTSIAAAISDLNAQGVSGPVVINISAGYVETAPVGGYSLFAVAGASSVNTITFQKSGSGNNPLISGYTGTATPSSPSQDGIWRLIGADYITIDATDLTDPNSSNPATMEFGFGLFKASPTDGCHNNTIKNCVISLSNVNNALGAGTAVEGSRGIDMINAMSGSHTTSLTVTTSPGSNSNNTFYRNIIKNCNVGIAMIGYPDVSPFQNADWSNTVGGSSSSGNVIANYGGGGTNTAAGIKTSAQYSLDISDNTIINNNGSAMDHPGPLYGIYTNTTTGADASILNNTITLNNSSTVSPIIGIEYNGSAAASAGNSVAISGNLFTNCSINSATTSSVFRAINLAGSMPSTTLGVTGNTLQGLNYQGTATGECTFVYNASNTQSFNASNNQIANSLSKTSGAIYFFYNNNLTKYNIISNNSVSGFTSTTTGAGINGFFHSNYSNSVTVSTSVTGNNFGNVKGWGFNRLYTPIAIAAGSVQAVDISSNTVSNCEVGALYGLWLAGGGGINSTTVNSNVISNNIAGAIDGMYFGTSGNVGQIAITANTISALTATGSTAGALNGLEIDFGMNITISGNKICDLTHQSSSGVVYGLLHRFGMNGYQISIHNNLVGNLYAPASNTNAVYGILLNCSVINGGTINVTHNSVYLSGTSSANNFGSSGLTFITSSSAPTLFLRNNILINNSVPTGTALAKAFETSSNLTSSINNLSNNNLFYAGIPSPNNVIYYNGTTAYSTLPLFKTLFWPRESASVSELPPFTSTVSSSPNYLNINPSLATQVSNGGVPVPGVTIDYAGNARSLSNPDIGAWEGTYTTLDQTAPNIYNPQYIGDPCSLNSRTITANLIDQAGVASGSVAPRCYYKINSGNFSSVTGVMMNGTLTNGTWNFAMNYTTTIGDTVKWFITSQDMNSPVNVGAYPANGFNATSVNSVSAIPNPLQFYKIVSLPTITGTVSPGAICAGKSATLSAGGASTYTWLPGALNGSLVTVVPNSSTIYTVTGSSVFGCQNSKTLSVIVNIVAITASNNAPVCAGHGLSLTAANGFTAYAWLGPNSFSSSQQSPIVNSVSMNAAGVYTVSGTAANSCTASATTTVSINPVPSVSITSSASLVCSGASAALSASGALTYTWSTAIISPSISVSPTVSTNYTVSGTMNGCTGQDTITLFVSPCTSIVEYSRYQCSIQPNPSSGLVIFVSHGITSGEITVINSLGEAVKKQIIIGEITEMDLRELQEGVYHFMFYTRDSFVYFDKIVILK